MANKAVPKITALISFNRVRTSGVRSAHRFSILQKPRVNCIRKGDEVVGFKNAAQLSFFAVYHKLPFSVLLGTEHEDLVYARQGLSVQRNTSSPFQNLY